MDNTYQLPEKTLKAVVGVSEFSKNSQYKRMLVHISKEEYVEDENGKIEVVRNSTLNTIVIQGSEYSKALDDLKSIGEEAFLQRIIDDYREGKYNTNQ